MPVQAKSRYVFTRTVVGLDDTSTLTDREPYSFKNDPLNQIHRVEPGDTLYALAERYLRSAGLWWIVADYQDPPITDPTLRLTPGSILIIPPESVLLAVFAEGRRDTETLV